MHYSRGVRYINGTADTRIVQILQTPTAPESERKGEPMAKQQIKRTHLRLVKSFDDEIIHEAGVAKRRAEAASNVTVIDFSSNMSAIETCLDSAQACKRAIASVERNAEMAVEEKVVKLAVLTEGLAKFEAAARAYMAAALEEVKNAA
jgi:hypothetical protein